MSILMNDAIRGAIIGNLMYDDIDNNLIGALQKITNRIKTDDNIDSTFLCEEIRSFDALYDDLDPSDGSVLCWIFPLAFYHLYDHCELFSEVVANVAQCTHDETSALVCVEYTRLMHDIFWKLISRDYIFELLPELDIFPDDVLVSANCKNTFLVSLWCFVHSTDFDDALNNLNEIDFSNNYTAKKWVSMVTGTLAGLYYGVSESTNTLLQQDSVKTVIEKTLL